MKTLFLMRHAKSSWKDQSLADHDRPLNKRGKNDAPRMGQLLLEQGFQPNRWLSSTALRARTTAEILATTMGFEGEIELRPNLYHGEPEDYIAAISELEDTAKSVIIFGHNPGLEELFEQLTGEEEFLPTAALAHVELPIVCWNDLNKNTVGQLINLWRPKEL